MPTDGEIKPRPLTAHDELILRRVFNPQLPFIDDEANESPSEDVGEKLTEAESAVITQIKELECHGVEAANKEDLPAALQLFTQSIELAPQRASGYNNRAQALRLVKSDAEAEADLDRAIALSKGKGQAASQAYTQRGLLRRLRDDETGAVEDFKRAAALGSDFARSQLVALNPYAAMCGAIVAEMMQQERACGGAVEQ